MVVLRKMFLLLAAVCCLCMPAGAVETSATAAILIDADSGRVLYEKQADRQMLIASTTKIMTALVALEQSTPAELVTVSGYAAGTEGSSMYLKAGEQLTLETLLYGLLLCSGNDAAVAVAEHIAGSETAFAKLMNEKAAELGMTNSSFANPNGLDHEKHYSTARDMAKLACAALKNPTLMRIASTKSVRIGGRTMNNHNKLLSMQSGCLGLKTGYTRAAGRTLVSCMEKNGQRLIAVTLQDGNDWADHQTLYAYGYDTYPACRGAVPGEVLQYAAVSGGLQATVPLVSVGSFSWPVAETEVLEMNIELDAPLTAPLRAGTRAGQAVFRLDGREVGRVDLLCGKTILPRLTSAMTTLKLSMQG